MALSANMGDRAVAVIGSGVSGLSAAWLLSKRRKVTLFEADDRIGGHCNTVDVGAIPVDTGFIVYNESAYPNLTALFRHLDTPTKPSDMSFAVSLDAGRLEYAGTSLDALFAQRRNLASPRFWSMLRDLRRFYRNAVVDLPRLGDISLAAYLETEGYGSAFRDDHLYPMAAAIWSTPSAAIGAYPAAAFIKFCDNHGLLKAFGRPQWRTVEGGSKVYVARLAQSLGDRIFAGCPVRSVRRQPGHVEVVAADGETRRFDEVVIATHADQALRLLADPSPEEIRLLGAFPYSRNEAVLHSDVRLMPRRRKVWSSWNYMADTAGPPVALSVTYWMNRLQGLASTTPLFVTLNPLIEPRPETIIRREVYEHPTFDAAALRAQQDLWSLQGQRGTWFCGAYFGAGFHEDGLQAGLAAAEALGGARRPWTVAAPAGRICIAPRAEPQLSASAIS